MKWSVLVPDCVPGVPSSWLCIRWSVCPKCWSFLRFLGCGWLLSHDLSAPKSELDWSVWFTWFLCFWADHRSQGHALYEEASLLGCCTYLSISSAALCGVENAYWSRVTIREKDGSGALLGRSFSYSNQLQYTHRWYSHTYSCVHICRAVWSQKLWRVWDLPCLEANRHTFISMFSHKSPRSEKQIIYYAQQNPPLMQWSLNSCPHMQWHGLPWWLSSKESTFNAGDVGLG